MFCIFYLLIGVKYKIRRGEKGFGKLIVAKYKFFFFFRRIIQKYTSLNISIINAHYIYREREIYIILYTLKFIDT